MTWYHLYVDYFLKRGGHTKELTYKTETEAWIQKTNLQLPGINWKTGVDILLYMKQITTENLLYSTGDATQYSVMDYMQQIFKKKKEEEICG